MQSILIFLLGILSRLYIWRYKPMIIGITGNVGKSSTKEAIGVVVSKIKKTRVAAGNLNNEIGLPLSIIGDWSEEYYENGPSFWFWLKVLAISYWRLAIGTLYPEVLILEYGADHPGDIKKLARKYKPHISVITAVGEIPVHVEFFSGSEHVAKEKSELVKILDSTDYAILNFDDLAVLGMRAKTKGRVWTYGFGEGANLRITNYGIMNYELRRSMNSKLAGIGFKLGYNESFVPVILHDVLGRGAVAASAAAAAVGLALGMNLVQISEALSEFKGLPGRLKLLQGIKNSIIIDDTYNASPASTHLALETLKDLWQVKGKTSRKVAVLGDMLELGKYSIQAHQEIGTIAGSFFDLLICVGDKAKFIAESASSVMPQDRIFKFDTSVEAKNKVRELIQEGDLVLVKGSQGIRMEKIVEEIMAEPEKAKSLLVRQSKSWKAK